MAELIEVVARLAPAAPVRTLRQGTRAAAVRAARTCYAHRAGRLGVALFAGLLETGAVSGGDGHHDAASAVRDRLSAPGRDLAYVLTASGARRLDDLGVPLPRPASGSIPLRYCVDWTEQRHHLAGVVGQALTSRLLELDWLRRASRGRAVHLTDTGRRELPSALGVSADLDSRSAGLPPQRRR